MECCIYDLPVKGRVKENCKEAIQKFSFGNFSELKTLKIVVWGEIFCSSLNILMEWGVMGCGDPIWCTGQNDGLL